MRRLYLEDAALRMKARIGNARNADIKSIESKYRYFYPPLSSTLENLLPPASGH
jgi:hypothetical protein